MSAVTTIIFLGCATWLATTILAESELFKPTRGLLDRQADHWEEHELWEYNEFGAASRMTKFQASLWKKLSYLHGCHLCCGTWVGLVIAIATPQLRPFGYGIVGVILSGLVYKAIGHIVLEVTGALKRMNQEPTS